MLLQTDNVALIQLTELVEVLDRKDKQERGAGALQELQMFVDRLMAGQPSVEEAPEEKIPSSPETISKKKFVLVKRKGRFVVRERQIVKRY